MDEFRVGIMFSLKLQIKNDSPDPSFAFCHDKVNLGIGSRHKFRAGLYRLNNFCIFFLLIIHKTNTT
jgi:hypothetical protein